MYNRWLIGVPIFWGSFEDIDNIKDYLIISKVSQANMSDLLSLLFLVILAVKNSQNLRVRSVDGAAIITEK